MKIMASGLRTSLQIDEETMGTVTDFIFLDSRITADGDCSHEIKSHLLLGRKSMTNLDSILKSITLPTKVQTVKAMVFPGVNYGCQSWTKKKAECRKWMLWNCGVGEDPWESLGMQGVNPKGNQSWLFIGRPDTEAPILWPPNVKKWLNGKDSDAGKDWRQEEKGTTEDETVGWHHWHDGHEFEQALGVGDGQGSLVSCSLWDRDESDMTEQLNWTEQCYGKNWAIKHQWLSPSLHPSHPSFLVV